MRKKKERGRERKEAAREYLRQAYRRKWLIAPDSRFRVRRNNLN